MKKMLLTLLFAAFMMPFAAKAQCGPGVTSCNVTIVMADSYGDGWLDGDDDPFYIRVYQGTTLRGSATLTGGTNGSQSISICSGDSVRFVMDGEDFYGESSFVILNGDGTTILSGDCYDYEDGDVVAVAMPVCPSCVAVSSMSVSGLNANGFTLTWDDANNGGSTYTVFLNGAVAATNLSDTTYTFTTLTPATTYTVSVVAVCSATDSSVAASISVLTPCVAIDLPMSESFDSASTFSCWELQATGNVGGSYGAGLVTIDGNTAFRFSSYSSASDYNQTLLSPMINVSSAATALSVNVRYATYGSNDVLHFGYITADDSVVMDPTGYTTTGSSDWQNYITIIPADAVRLFVHYYGNYSYYAWIDYVNVTEVTGSVCYAVSNLTVDSVTSSSISISWSDANNSGASYTIYDMSDTSVVASGINDTTYTIDNLAPNTQYTFGVVANCSSTSESDIITVNGRTSCAPEALPFSETFSASLSSNPCWYGNTAVTAADVFGGANLAHGSVSAWTYSSSTSNGLDAGHYRVNIWGSSCKKWLVTPEIDLTTASNPVLQFDVAFTAYSGTGAATGFTDNASQAFIVAFSTDGGQTWDSTSAVRWQNAGGQHTLAEIASTSYINQTINLSQFIGETVRIAFYAQSTTSSGGDNNLHIDNIYVDEAPSCFPVAGLTIDSTTSSSISLSWSDTINTGATYTVYDMSDTSVVASNISGTAYTVTGLNANTPYTFGVEVNCSATDMARIMTVAGRTECGITAIPYTEGFESMPTGATPMCWSKPTSGSANVNSGYSNSGSNSLKFSGVAGNNVVVLPEFNQEINGLQVRFYTRPESITNASCGTFSVGYLTNPAVDSTFVVKATYNYNDWTAAQHEEKTVAMDGAPAGSRIAFRHDAASTAWYWFVDDVTVEVAGDTTAPVLDSVTLVTAVNNPTMGTIVPAPGTYRYALTDSVHIEATPFTGYNFIGWNMQFTFMGTTFDSTIYTTVNTLDGTLDAVDGMVINLTALFSGDTTAPGNTYTVTATVNDTTMGDVFGDGMVYSAGDTAFVWAFPNSGYRFVNWTSGTNVVSTDNPYEFVITSDVTLVANFEADSTISADSLTIITAVNDATMGTITPAPGIHRYAEGDIVTITATPNAGYYFGGWIMTMDLGFFVYTDTVIGAPATFTDTVTSDDLGMVMEYTALFTADSVPIVNPDSIIVTLAVNNANMGTITPAPGTYTYTEADSIHVIATAFAGYQFIGWNIQGNYYGYGFDTTIYTNVSTLDESFEDMGGAILTVTALFAVDTNGQGTTYTVTVTVNDATMGSVSGAGTYNAGSTVSITATANNGYSFVGWVINGDTITANPYTFTITSDVNALAVFVANNGIEDADMANVTVYGAESRIVVRGAEGKDVYVFDLNGRMVASQLNAAAATEFRMASTGVYLVKVGNAPAKRVLVVR